MNGEWKALNDRKWELKQNDRVLATIFHKADNNFSLYVSSPKIYKTFSEISVTHQYPNLEEAQSACAIFLSREVFDWATAVCEYVRLYT